MSDIDIPSVTTACHECKELGHFCRATQWVGDTENGICAACASGKDCAVIAAHLPPESIYEIDRFDQPAGPVREVPKELWPTQVEEAKAEVPLYGRGRTFFGPVKTGATTQKRRPKIIRPCKYCGELFSHKMLTEHRPYCEKRPAKLVSQLVEIPIEDAKVLFPYIPEPKEVSEVSELEVRVCSREGCGEKLGVHNTTGRCGRHFYIPKKNHQLQQSHKPKPKKAASPEPEPKGVVAEAIAHPGNAMMFLSTPSGPMHPIPANVFRSSAYGLVLQDLLAKREDLDNVIAFIRRLEVAPQ